MDSTAELAGSTATIFTPLTYATVNRIKKIEGVDHFDYDENYKLISE